MRIVSFCLLIFAFSVKSFANVKECTLPTQSACEQCLKKKNMPFSCVQKNDSLWYPE